MKYRVDDLSESKARQHGELEDASEIASLLDELANGPPRVWSIWNPRDRKSGGLTFALGGGVCGLVQFSVDGGPPWWFLRSQTTATEGAEAQWNGEPWELFPADMVTREELHQVLDALARTGKRDPKSKWEKIDG